jgi:hypothetical protein
MRLFLIVAAAAMGVACGGASPTPLGSAGGFPVGASHSTSWAGTVDCGGGALFNYLSTRISDVDGLCQDPSAPAQISVVLELR